MASRSWQESSYRCNSVVPAATLLNCLVACMAQPNDKYTHELSNGIISSNQAEILIELKTLLGNLEEVCVALAMAESH
jgi:hypothetical protein